MMRNCNLVQLDPDFKSRYKLTRNHGNTKLSLFNFVQATVQLWLLLI